MPKCSVDTCFVDVPDDRPPALCLEHFEKLPEFLRRALRLEPDVCRATAGMSSDKVLEMALNEIAHREEEDLRETTSMGPIPDGVPPDF